MGAVAHMLPVAFGAAISPVVLIVNVLLLSGNTRVPGGFGIYLLTLGIVLLV
jgi:hypothetical protein